MIRRRTILALAILAALPEFVDAAPRSMTFYSQHGRTATGEQASETMTCADRRLPLNSGASVTWHGQTVRVRINDRTARKTTALDCRRPVFRALHVPLRDGRVVVDVTRDEPREVASAPEHERRK